MKVTSIPASGPLRFEPRHTIVATGETRIIRVLADDRQCAIQELIERQVGVVGAPRSAALELLQPLVECGLLEAADSQDHQGSTLDGESVVVALSASGIEHSFAWHEPAASALLDAVRGLALPKREAHLSTKPPSAPCDVAE